MSKLQKNVRISPEEYLEGEKYSEARHEYVRGEVYAMVGASRTHNLICVNLLSALHAHLRGTPCRAFVADMKVRVDDAFYYPDLLVACNLDRQQEYYVDEPILVIEVLSETTRQRDELDKRIAYQSLKSLKEYTLIAQDKKEVRVFRRGVEGWELETFARGDWVRFTSILLKLPIEIIYEEVLVGQSLP